ncbi:hypothetical protein C7378_2585 [Acidipila rosea]|uniref:Uncharacterized protein n=1 Tax=Acidipila rosea TaxID=768535 RepID=A0A4V2PV16_9BACT|nr:hypothetical protein C7378_2585 [Acidipila rosea]
MYCSGCGQNIQPGEAVCMRCGRPVTPLPPVGMPVMQGSNGRVHRNIQTMGILWLVWGAWSVLGWLIALPFLTGALGGWGHHWSGYWGPGRGYYGFPHMMWLPPLLTAIVFARAGLAAATGYGLLRRASWARTLAIVTAFLTLVKPITGTILAIYTLWVLVPAPAQQEYDEMAVP